MKTLIRILTLNLITLGTLFGNHSFAEKMNSETQDLVIERMERLILNLEKNDPTWLPSQQRLADLLSERARTRFMQEVEANCQSCKGSEKDRAQAILIYETILKNRALNDSSSILFQLAHLYDMAGQPERAIELFERIIKDSKTKNISSEIVARSHSGIGDLLFSKGKFNLALTHYSSAIRFKNVPSRGLIFYNMAWSELNLNRVNSGIKRLETLAKNPELITRESSDGPKYDVVFHTDILRDLATFYARRNITLNEIDTYDKSSPKEKRKELLLHFASEADRLGQKQAARKIYNRYLEDPTITAEERLSIFIKLMQVNYDAGMTAQSTADFTKAAETFKKICPDPNSCPELEKTMKRYVTELHRAKKVNPDLDLLNSYVVYNQTFPLDFEMAERGAVVADSLGKHSIAVTFLRSVSDNPSASLQQKQKSLATEISVAEKSNDKAIRKAAYDHYLAVFPQGDKSSEVQYQLAYLDYQQKNFREAAIAFNTIAKSKEAKIDLRKKSADLSLDCLVNMTYEESLEDWAWEYAKLFPQSKAEYEKIARKALANRTAKVANNNESTTSNLRKSLVQLQNFNTAGSSSEEKQIHYTNMAVLSQRLNEDEIYLESLKAMLLIPGITDSRREETLSRLVGYYEKKLDFRNAYLTAAKMKFKNLTAKDRHLRLGTLQDLAGMNPTNHYKQALKSGLKGPTALSLRQRLVILSASPAQELKVQASELRRNPEVLNETILLVYARTKNKTAIKSILSMKELARQTAPNFIDKQDFYREVIAFRNRISSHKLIARTDSLMQKTIKQRIKLLKEADKYLAQSLRFKDVTSQLLVLNIVGTENDRMVTEILALPTPKNLNSREQTQYLEALKAQSKPYFAKANMAQQKESEIWNRSKALEQLIQNYASVRPELKSLLRHELELLSTLPRGGRLQSEVKSALNEISITRTDLDSARKAVSQNPGDIRQIENLKILETKIGHPLMPTYLDARLSQIQKGRRL